MSQFPVLSKTVPPLLSLVLFLCCPQVQKRVGYCPQFDGLIEFLTVAEALWLYARLRGVTESSIPATVSDLITDLLLTENRNKLCSTLR